MKTQAQHNEQRLADAIPDGIVMLDQNYEIQWWNQHAELLLQLNSDYRHKSITDILSNQQWSQLLTSSEADKLDIQSPKNANQYLSLVLRKYQQQYLLIIRDVTHTVRLEAMRQDFIANVSHELRTPLTVLHGYLELLLDKKADEDAQAVQMLQEMAGQSQRMERLVEDLLLLSRLESAQLNKADQQMVAVAVLLEDIVNDAKSYSGEQQHEFILDLDASLMLQGNANELHSAFSNLIYNAVQYTPAKGTIQVYCGMKKGKVCVSVQDSGIGIENKHIPRITQRFYRVDKSRSYRGKGGTGLGLAIVKHVLLRHHGELTIESQLGKGSCFSLMFH